jgi:hypothetical protein
MVVGIAYTCRTVINLPDIGAFADITLRDAAVAILGIAILASAMSRGTCPFASGIAYAAATRQNFSRTALDFGTTAVVWFITCRTCAASGVSRPVVCRIAYALGTVIHFTGVGAFAYILVQDAAVTIRKIPVFTRAASGISRPVIRCITYTCGTVVNFTQVAAFFLILFQYTAVATWRIAISTRAAPGISRPVICRIAYAL